MNQRTVLGIALVFVLAAFTQCTIQKRIYRKGYYISFNKTPKRVTESHEEKKLAVFLPEDSTTTEEIITKESQLAAVELQESTDSMPDPVLNEFISYTGATNGVGDLKETLEGYVKQVVSIAGKADEVPEKKGARESQLAVILVTILLFMLGVALVYLAIAIESPYLAVLGILLGIISLVLLLVGLAVEDSVANKEKAEKIKAENELKKKQQQQLSEEDWYELKQKQYQKAVRITILLVVLFFGISLFAIAVGEALPLIVITGAMFLIFLAFVWGTYKSKRKEDPVISTES